MELDGQPSRQTRGETECTCLEKWRSFCEIAGSLQPGSAVTPSAIPGSSSIFARDGSPVRAQCRGSLPTWRRSNDADGNVGGGRGLLRELLRRGGVERDRILLTEFRSTDWQSLTFIGEQHRIRLRIPAPDSAEIAASLVNGLEDAELSLPGHLVADLALAGELERNADGSISMTLEALTVEN